MFKVMLLGMSITDIADRLSHRVGEWGCDLLWYIAECELRYSIASGIRLACLI